MLGFAFGPSVLIAVTPVPEEILSSSAFMFTRSVAIYINVKMKTRIDPKFILMYFTTSLG
jgi:hypothetical protein